MSKKNIAMVVLAVVLGLAYVIWFTDWFRPKQLRIAHTARNLERFAARGNALPGLRFRVNPPSRFTDLKVVLLTAYETNKNATPVWHLMSEKGSDPVTEFSYGFDLRGMHPAISGVHADALQTNVTYRLFITAGSAKGEHDFEIQ